MRSDWADNLYPGQGNEAGRKALEDHLEAMLDLDEGKPLVHAQPDRCSSRPRPRWPSSASPSAPTSC